MGFKLLGIPAPARATPVGVGGSGGVRVTCGCVWRRARSVRAAWWLACVQARVRRTGGAAEGRHGPEEVALPWEGHGRWGVDGGTAAGRTRQSWRRRRCRSAAAVGGSSRCAGTPSKCSCSSGGAPAARRRSAWEGPPSPQQARRATLARGSQAALRRRPPPASRRPARRAATTARGRPCSALFSGRSCSRTRCRTPCGL